MFTKLEKLKNILKEMESVIIAYSGGIDSTFLVKIAHEVLKGKVLAVIGDSPTYPEREKNEALIFLKQNDIEFSIINTDEIDNNLFTCNSENRCYHCKKDLFTKLTEIADLKGCKVVLDGVNHDDLLDWRPGIKAARELGVRSPLAEVGLTKEEIRLASKNLGLATWNKPAMACLSSRIPYGQTITKEKLTQIEAAESYLRQKGFENIRVRHHLETARIEIPVSSFPALLTLKSDLINYFKRLGFVYITLDLEGFRSGSMNEVTKKSGTRGESFEQ